jgi:hypothetical protein
MRRASHSLLAGVLLLYYPSYATLGEETPIYNFVTIAGDTGYGYAEGTNTDARFHRPSAIAADRDGNLYVAEASYFSAEIANNTVRKLTRVGTNLVSSTISGVAQTKGSADGTNRNSLLSDPYGVAVDASGNVYVADSGNHTIRKITAVGADWVTTTIAGLAGLAGNVDGTNSDARFGTPAGVAVDSAGNVYVADPSNYNIRQLTPVGTNWVTTTIAGVGGYGIAVDTSNNVYVADTSNNSVRQVRWDGTNWVTSTLIANGGFNQPYGLAVDSGGNLFLGDRLNHLVRRIAWTGTNWVITSIGGQPGYADGTNSDAKFVQPIGVAVDGQDRVYVAEYGNAVIRQLTSEGTNWVTTTITGKVAGAGSTDGTNRLSRFNYPSGVAIDSHGIVYVADALNHLIRQITPVGPDWITSTISGLPGVPGGADGTNSDARFDTPRSVAVDATGNIYVADQGNSTIRQLRLVGTNWVTSTVVGLAGSPGGIDGTNSDARLNGPLGIAAGSNGKLYISDSGNGTIRELSPVGANWILTTIAGLAGATGNTDGTNSTARFSSPWGIAVGSGGRVFVASLSSIRQIEPVGADWVTTTIGGLPGSCSSADSTNSKIRFCNAIGVAVDSSGNLFVLDVGNATILKLTPVGTGWVPRTIAGRAVVYGNTDGTNGIATFNIPLGLAVDKFGDIYVGDAFNACIRKGSTDSDRDGIPDGWMLQWFGHATGQSTDSSLALEDADQDGLANLIEYAVGTLPKSPVMAQNGILVTTESHGGDTFLIMTFKRRQTTTALEYVPEVSGDKLTWYADATHVQEISTLPVDDQFDLVTVRDLIPTVATAPRYFRIRARVVERP